MIFLNQHGTNFVPSGFPSNRTYEEASFADFNGDGSLDLLLHDLNWFSVWTNAAPAPPEPKPPANPSAISLAPQLAEFHWNPPESSAGFTYNLRIGTTRGGVDIVSPHSDPLTGSRQIVEMGNAGPGGVYRIGRLYPGTYFWSVQSINQAHRGSRFSTEQEFVHTTIPLIRSFTVTNITLNGAELSAEINPGGLPAGFYFEYSTNLESLSRTAPAPLAQSTSFEAITHQLVDLRERSTWFVRLTATNALGTNEMLLSFMNATIRANAALERLDERIWLPTKLSLSFTFGRPQ